MIDKIKKIISKKTIIFILMIIIWVVMIVSQVHGASSSRFSHPFAWIHMTSCWIAEVFILAMILSEHLSVLSQYRNFNRLALIYQSLGIMTGMLWAYDAPDWGAFWQWDFIENSALLIWIALLFSQNTSHARSRFFWNTLILSLLTVQTLMLFGGLKTGLGSRHHYAETNHALIIEMIVWVLSLAVCHYQFNRKTALYKSCIDDRRFNVTANVRSLKGDKLRSPQNHQVSFLHNPGICYGLEVFCGCLMIGFILLSLLTDTTPITWILGIILALVWIILAVVTKGRKVYRIVLCALGLITLVWNFMLPATVTDQWIQLGNEQSINLYGIEVSEEADCLQYTAWVGKQAQDSVQIPLKYCHHEVVAQKPVDYMNIFGMQFYRIQALDYRAKDGLLVRTKEIQWDLLFKYWLILLMCIGFIHAVRNALCNSKEYQSWIRG